MPDDNGTEYQLPPPPSAQPDAPAADDTSPVTSWPVFGRPGDHTPVQPAQPEQYLLPAGDVCPTDYVHAGAKQVQVVDVEVEAPARPSPLTELTELIAGPARYLAQLQSTISTHAARTSAAANTTAQSLAAHIAATHDPVMDSAYQALTDVIGTLVSYAHQVTARAGEIQAVLVPAGGQAQHPVAETSTSTSPHGVSTADVAREFRALLLAMQAEREQAQVQAVAVHVDAEPEIAPELPSAPMAEALPDLSPPEPGVPGVAGGAWDVRQETGESSYLALDPFEQQLIALPEEEAGLVAAIRFADSERLSDDYTATRDALVKLGSTLLSQTDEGFPRLQMQPEALIRVWAYIGFVSGGNAKAYQDIKDFPADSGYSLFYDDLLTAYRLLGRDSTYDLQCLLAVRVMSEALRDWHLTADGTTHIASHSRIGIAPEAFGVGGGGSAEFSGTYVVTQAAKVALAIVPFVELLDKLIAAEVPTDTGGVPDLIESYLAGRMQLNTLRYFLRMAGANWATVQGLLLARRGRPSEEECIRLWLRGELSDDEVHVALRTRGYILKQDRDQKLSLARELPAAADVIRLMVRNVFDEDIVKSFDLNAEFERKYAGPLAQWGKAAGLPLDVVQALWRAHWVVPSPGQLYTMVQRLRPGAVAPELVTEYGDAMRALGENDVLPFWRKRLLAISYHPLSRIDARRAYNSGALSRDEYVAAMQDLGYDQANAERMARFADTLRAQAIIKTNWAQLYLKYALSAAEATARLLTLGYSQAEIDSAIQTLQLERKALARERELVALKARIVGGDPKTGDVQAVLNSLGYSPEESQSLLAEWLLELKHKPKFDEAASLRRYYLDGVLSLSDYGVRLNQLGYDQATIATVLQDAQLASAERDAKRATAAAAAATKQSAADRKAAAAQLRAAKAAAKAAAAEQAKAERDVVKRVRELHRLAARIADYTGETRDSVEEYLTELSDELLADPQLTPDIVDGIVADAADAVQHRGSWEEARFRIRSAVVEWYAQSKLSPPASISEVPNAE